MKQKNGRIVLYLMLTLIVLLLGYLTYNYFINYKEVDNNKNNNIIENNIKLNENNENEFNTVEYNNYVYVMPKEVEYDYYIRDEKMILHLYKNKYKSFTYDYDKIEKALKYNDNIMVKNRRNFERNNKKVVSFEVYNGNMASLAVYLDAYDNYAYELEIYNGNERIVNYDALYMTLDILSTATKLGE